MPEGIGYGFAPFQDDEERKRRMQNGGADGTVQEAIKILSLRMPSFSEQAIVPDVLTGGLGGPISPVGPPPGMPGSGGVPAPGTALPPPPDFDYSGPPGPPNITIQQPPDDFSDEFDPRRTPPGRPGGRQRFPV